MSKKTNQQTFLAMTVIVLSLVFGVAFYISLQDVHPKQTLKTVPISHTAIEE